MVLDHSIRKHPRVKVRDLPPPVLSDPPAQRLPSALPPPANLTAPPPIRPPLT